MDTRVRHRRSRHGRQCRLAKNRDLLARFRGTGFRAQLLDAASLLRARARPAPLARPDRLFNTEPLLALGASGQVPEAVNVVRTRLAEHRLAQADHTESSHGRQRNNRSAKGVDKRAGINDGEGNGGTRGPHPTATQAAPTASAMTARPDDRIARNGRNCGRT
jgi:hypothetical protein